MKKSPKTTGVPTSSKQCNFSHTFILQVTDGFGYPLPGTEFPLTVELIRLAKGVFSLKIPQFNFQTTDQISPISVVDFVAINGGYVITQSNPLPKKLRPTEAQNYVLANNDAWLVPLPDPNNPPFPTADTPAFNFSINIFGQVFISAQSVLDGIIPQGGHTSMGTSVLYTPGRNPLRKIKLDSFPIQPAFTNFVNFSNPEALDHGIRDSHVNDTFGDTVYYAWTSNADQADKSNNVMDAYFAKGHIRHGRIDMGPPQRLTSFSNTIMAWDVAVAVNRVDPLNVVYSYGFKDNSVFPPIDVAHALISTDGGNTFPTDVIVMTNYGDCRGVIADKEGNFWYCTTVNTDPTQFQAGLEVQIWQSTDKGSTWQLRFQTAESSVANFLTYDYPQIAVGSDGNGNYGLWWVADFTDFFISFGAYQVLGFVPSDPSVSIPPPLRLTNFTNLCVIADLIVAPDGTVYIMGAQLANSALNPTILVKKLPGPLDLALVQSPVTIFANIPYLRLNAASFPAINSYFPFTVQSITYDPIHNLLFAMMNNRFQFTTENYQQFIVASGDNGITWSPPIDIPKTSHNNRGFSTMAFNLEKESLVFGWHDGVNDPNQTSTQYLGAYLNSKAVKKIAKSVFGRVL